MLFELVHLFGLLAVKFSPHLNPEVAFSSMVRLVEQSDASNLVSIVKLAPNHRVNHLVPYWLESLECRLEVNLDFTTSLVHFILPSRDHTFLE